MAVSAKLVTETIGTLLKALLSRNDSAGGRTTIDHRAVQEEINLNHNCRMRRMVDWSMPSIYMNLSVGLRNIGLRSGGRLGSRVVYNREQLYVVWWWWWSGCWWSLLLSSFCRLVARPVRLMVVACSVMLSNGVTCLKLVFVPLPILIGDNLRKVPPFLFLIFFLFWKFEITPKIYSQNHFGRMCHCQHLPHLSW